MTNNCILDEVWEEITYPFPNFNGAAWRHQAITWTNVDLSSVRSSENHQGAIS